MDVIDKEALVCTKLADLGFDLKRDPGSLDWIVWDRRAGKGFLKAIPATRCQELDTIVEFFQLEL